jgi:hypothetical protein
MIIAYIMLIGSHDYNVNIAIIIIAYGISVAS